jgi:glycerate 2-kinase
VSGPREQLIELYCAAVGGANVESLTAKGLAAFPLERRQRVWVFACGKAAHAMAAAAVGTLQRSLAEIAGGIVVAPEDGEPPCGTVPVLVGDHPVPGRRSFAAAARIAQIITQKRGTDLGVVLISGGTSSLIGAPLRGMSEADLSHLHELVLGSGLDIHGMNTVRKRFALFGAGRMALALAPARTICLAVSDVPGDDLASIGSGPCVADPARVQHVLEALHRAHLTAAIPASFRQYLQDVARGVIAETPKASHPAFAHVTARVVANNAVALEAAAGAARRSGFTTAVHEPQLTGDAAVAGALVAESLLKLRGSATPGSLHCCIWGGETTVTLNGGAPRGGRCQELALAAARLLHDAGDQARGITLLSAGTDGRDGRTDAAGAVIDDSTWAAIAATGRDPAAALRAHHSHDALAAASALFSPGLTGTNVMDVTIGLVRA